MSGPIVEGGGWEEKDVAARWTARKCGRRLLWLLSLAVPILLIRPYVRSATAVVQSIASVAAWAWACLSVIFGLVALYFAVVEPVSTRRILVRKWKVDDPGRNH